MSVEQCRRDLDRKRKARVDAERTLGEYRTKESRKRAEAARARLAASKSTSASTMRSKLNEAERKEKEAESAGKEANRWQDKVSALSKDEAALQTKLAREEKQAADAAERARQRALVRSEREAKAERARVESRIRGAESAAREALRRAPEPKVEKLRVLILGAAADGDLRLSREQKRIQSAVRSALHRDQIDLDVRPAATTADFLDGLSSFRPHVLHFSGHSDVSLLFFERNEDDFHKPVGVSASAFASALAASDTPPQLVLLNSCNSAAQLEGILNHGAAFAIGMAAAVADTDAINFAARFYTSIADGQSIGASHALAKAQLELDGVAGAELPILEWAADVDPWKTVLVAPYN